MKKVLSLAAMMLLAVAGLSACTTKNNQQVNSEATETENNEVMDLKGKKV